MRGQTVWLGCALLMLLTPVARARDFGDRVNARLDRRGAHVERVFDARAERSAALGYDGRAARLERRGERRDNYWDRRGDLFDRRWDRWAQ